MIGNSTSIWEGLTHCEQLSYLSQVGKMFLNVLDLDTTQIVEIKTTLWALFMKMIDEGCWV